MPPSLPPSDTATALATDVLPRVTRGWMTRFAALIFAVNIAWSAPAQLLIANQVLAWHPQDKEVRFGWLMAAGGLVSIIASPAAGWLSDRTTSRWGGRAPWIVAGVIGSAMLLLCAAAAANYWQLFAAWAAFQVTIAASVTVSQAIAPDEVPARQFGVVSGVMGLMYTLAVVVGSVIGGLLPLRAAYVASAALLVLASVPYALATMRGGRSGAYQDGAREDGGQRDDVSGPMALPVVPLPPGGASDALTPAPTARSSARRVLLSPEYHDVRWVFIARALVTIAQSLALFYLLYFLRDRVHLADPDAGVVVLSAVYAACVIVTAVASGWFSDRIGRRKVFVSASSFGVAIAAVIMAFTTSWPVIVALAAAIGVSWGVYQSIDQALMNEVLPSADARGRDLGMLQLAVAIPNTFTPVIAAFLVTSLGGYSTLYLCAAAFTTLGGLVVWKVRAAT